MVNKVAFQRFVNFGPGWLTGLESLTGGRLNLVYQWRRLMAGHPTLSTKLAGCIMAASMASLIIVKLF